jgi:hypothetical protein
MVTSPLFVPLFHGFDVGFDEDHSGGCASYDFCFLGIETGAVVAVSTLGTKEALNLFMSGFKEMCSAISPELVLCYCRPYQEMYGFAEIMPIEHEGRIASLKARALRNDVGQTLLDYI